MAQPYVGEIRMFGGNYAPAGWMMCDGQLLPISENETLFNLIGTTYGGDGQSTFALPDLRGRAPLHQGTGQSSYTLAQNGGVTDVTLSTNQIPAHSHPAVANDTASATTSGSPANAFYGNTSPNQLYTNSPIPRNIKTMVTVPAQGGNQPHDNMQPFLAVSFIISLFGLFPSQT